MNRRTIMGLVAAGSLGFVTGASAVAFGAHGDGRVGMRGAIMKRVVGATIDDALDTAQVSADQRAAIHGARDRVFVALEEGRAHRRTHLEEALRLFEAAQVDPAQIEALERQGEAERQRVREVIHQAIVEAHGVLTPPQRKVVADYVRAHRLDHMH